MRIGFISGSTDVGCFYILGGDNKLHKVDVGSDGMFSFDIDDSPIRANSQLQLIREETIADPKAFVGGCEGEPERRTPETARSESSSMTEGRCGSYIEGTGSS